MLFDDTARNSSCSLLLSFLFNVNIIPATLSSSELAVVVPGWGWVVVQVVRGKFRYKNWLHPVPVPVRDTYNHRMLSMQSTYNGVAVVLCALN